MVGGDNKRPVRLKDFLITVQTNKASYVLIMPKTKYKKTDCLPECSDAL
jgi:hypothetical protein